MLLYIVIYLKLCNFVVLVIVVKMKYNIIRVINFNYIYIFNYDMI